MTKEQILEHAKALGPKEREELIHDLRQLGDDEELSQEQRQELLRRVDAMDRGTTTMLDGEQVMRELRERVERA